MMAFLGDWLLALWRTLCDAGPYLLLGLSIAGFMQALVPRERVLRHFGGNDFRSVLKAALVGIPLPLCSCSVIPTAMQLRKSGASKGATSAFLISTPETGVDSIGMTWAMLDPLMTFARPIAALLTSVGTGLGVNWLVRRGWDGRGNEESPADEADSCCAGEGSSPAAGASRSDEHAGHAHDAATESAPAARPRGFVATCRAALAYAFGDLLDDLAGWLIVGFLVSGLILLLVPDDFFGGVLPLGWPSMLVMLVVGMPLYVCASATTPIAAALIAKGLDPGAALVLLLAGPATNLATMAIVSRFLGRRILVVYCLGIAVFSLVCGAIVDRIYARIGPIQLRSIQGTHEMSPGTIAWIGGVILTYLLVRSAIRTRLLSSVAAGVRRACAPLGVDPFAGATRAVLVLGILCAYASTAFTSVAPGESAFVLRFGAVAARSAGPGLLAHLPFPIDRVERVRTDEVRAATFGFEEGRAAPQGSDKNAESEAVAGDETILRVTYAVHYRVSDAEKFLFGLADPERALRSAAEASARRMIGHRRSESVLVDSREDMQAEMLALITEEVGALDVGIAPVAVHLIYVHVPQRVHDAYLDVVSAQEDKEAAIRDAEKYRAQRRAEARGRAFAVEQDAAAKQSEIVGRASGEATAFDALRGAHDLDPAVDRSRRLRAALSRALERSTLILLLARDVDVRLTEGGRASGGDARSEPDPSRLPESMEH